MSYYFSVSLDPTRLGPAVGAPLRGGVRMTMQFDRESKRWTLDVRGLHYGDGIDVWLCERWVPVRVE